MDSDKVPIITDVDNALVEDEAVTENGKGREAEEGTELVVVENGVKSDERRDEREEGEEEDDMAEEPVVTVIGADDEEVKQVKVEAEVMPETVAQFAMQPPPEEEEGEEPPSVTVVTAHSAAEEERGGEPGADVKPQMAAIVAAEVEQPEEVRKVHDIVCVSVCVSVSVCVCMCICEYVCVCVT